MSQQINLYNPAFRKQEKPFSAATMALSLGLVVLGAVALFGYAKYQSRGLEQTFSETDVRLATQREQVNRIASELAPQGASKLLADELARADAQLKERQQLLENITGGVSANTQGYSGLMTALARRATTGVWLTGFSVSEDSALSIKGRVLDASLVPSYIRSLNAEAAIRGRDVADLKLSARPDPAAAAKPAAVEPGKKTEPAAPTRYVEFSVSLGRQGAGTTAALRPPSRSVQ